MTRRRACPAYDCDRCEFTYTRVSEAPPRCCPRCKGPLRYIGWLVGVDNKQGDSFELVGELIDRPEPHVPVACHSGTAEKESEA